MRPSRVALDRVTLGSAAAAGGLTISVAVTESGSYIVRFGTDGRWSLLPGATTGTLTVPTADDNLDEPDGSHHCRVITTGAGYTVGTPSTAMVTVNDNDIPDPDAPVVRASLRRTQRSITEGDCCDLQGDP